MGCIQSVSSGSAYALEQVLDSSFPRLLPRDKGLQQLLRRTFVQGLETPVSRRCLFSVLRLEEDFLENRMFTLLDANKDGFITLEEVLLALARTAAGETLRQTMRLHEVGQQRVGGPHEWEDSPNAVRRQAAFAFQLYDLDGNGELTAKEVAVLVSECIGGNARVVENNIHAIGAVRNAMVDEHGFRLMALHAGNFLFPAFRLQQRMAQYGQTASEALAALRQFFGKQEGRASSSSSAPKKSPLRRPANQAFDFGDEQETPPPPPRPSHQSHHSHHDHGREAAVLPPPSPPPPPPQVMHNGGGRHSQESGVPAPRQPRQSYGPNGVHADELRQHSEAGQRAQGARQYPSEEDVAAAFRDVRLGRTADIESAVTLGALPIDIVFQPHGATLLHVAAAHGHRSLCKRLLALGAPVAALDALGRSAAEVALAYRHWEVAAMLRYAGVPVSPEAEMHSLRERTQWEASQVPQMQHAPQDMWQPGADRAGQWDDGGGGLQEEEEEEDDWDDGRRHSRGDKLA